MISGGSCDTEDWSNDWKFSIENSHTYQDYKFTTLFCKITVFFVFFSKMASNKYSLLFKNIFKKYYRRQTFE